ncbi:MAG TPA: histidinol dehydrogenase [Pyrinomonadaceae bacterium]|nr:histidinol dehydrogenase [Pyrinomonadaceae bacterium]
MRTIKYPARETWSEIFQRPYQNCDSIIPAVGEILSEVRELGDDALRGYSRRFDGVDLVELELTEAEFESAVNEVPDELKDAIAVAKKNIETFHVLPEETRPEVETAPGVICWRKRVAIEKVGLYVPGGTAPLFSTVLMLAIPATLAGCREIVLCSPPGKDGKINAATLYAARLCGVTKVYKIGGAQAIAAMAYGTETVPIVYKIFGPGNQFVTEAKRQVSQAGVAIDMPAGPSEVAVLADDTAVPSFVAADLLSQAEHGTDSQVLLVSTSEQLIDKTLAEVELQLAKLPRHDIATTAIANSKAVLVESVQTGLDLVNEYAPEHLIIATADAEQISEGVINAGSVFVGNLACESAGDYASGTNHTLPTNGFARAFSGLSVDSFTKTITFQRMTADGLRTLGPTIEVMARAEGLNAHERAVSVRLESLGGAACSIR